ncbi:MAG: bifunctional diaminohydroxyphosphoribosylaminopyrimidine deaminase/5-amino-6-(5-phosphoribosylamino)uracil reductase RibD [Anaerovoracaceae bacterium]
MDEKYMKTAIELALRGEGFVHPNPLVGAVIVKEGEIIGRGYHQVCGGLHAERNAIKNVHDIWGNKAEALLKDSTMYVTLEPCCHYGKTPPCTEAIIENKIGKVIIGSMDPNPKVAGDGVAILKKANIHVVCNFMQLECERLNKVFFHYIQTQKPYVVMKYAMTLDGKIATRTGDSKWITGPEARKHVHKLRHNYTGIMVGIRTVLADDPMLNCRIEGLESPVRIVCDTNLKIPMKSNLVKTAKEYRTIIITCSDNKGKIEELIESGVEILPVKSDGNHVNLNSAMIALGKLEIDSILLEGGATLNGSMMDAGLVKKVMVYIGPKIFGGKDAKGPVSGKGVAKVGCGSFLQEPKVTILGEDILIESEVTSCLQE